MWWNYQSSTGFITNSNKIYFIYINFSGRDSCQTNTCKHEGVCTDTEGDVKCKCVSPYGGKTCNLGKLFPQHFLKWNGYTFNGSNSVRIAFAFRKRHRLNLERIYSEQIVSFRADAFSERDKCTRNQTGSYKVCSGLLIKTQDLTPVVFIFVCVHYSQSFVVFFFSFRIYLSLLQLM